MCPYCGKCRLLTKHHILPQRFYKFIPLKYRNELENRQIDICRKCHDKYEERTTKKISSLIKRLGLVKTADKIKKKRKVIDCVLNINRTKKYLDKDIRYELIRNRVHFSFCVDLKNEDIEKYIRIDRGVSDNLLINKLILRKVKNYKHFELEWIAHFESIMKKVIKG